MTANGSCGGFAHSLSVLLEVAYSPAVSASCLGFYNELIKVPEGPN